MLINKTKENRHSIILNHYLSSSGKQGLPLLFIFKLLNHNKSIAQKKKSKLILSDIIIMKILINII